jgi:hypothetical protein
MLILFAAEDDESSDDKHDLYRFPIEDIPARCPYILCDGDHLLPDPLPRKLVDYFEQCHGVLKEFDFGHWQVDKVNTLIHRAALDTEKHAKIIEDGIANGWPPSHDF